MRGISDACESTRQSFFYVGINCQNSSKRNAPNRPNAERHWTFVNAPLNLR